MPSLTPTHTSGTISAIVPTIGRPSSLTRLLDSLARQTYPLTEIIVADGSSDDATAAVVADTRWSASGLRIERIPVQPPHAVRQRVAAIARARGEFLLFLDDDVELEPDCVEQLVEGLTATAGAVGACADFSNQVWPAPPLAWRLYMKYVLGLEEGAWQGRVVGPLLRFGYNPSPMKPALMEWFSTSGTLVRRDAYDACGGFSDFFLHRSTINEDLDLGLKLSRRGSLVLCGAARLAHFHSPGGRVSVTVAAEDDLFNRYLILRKTIGASRWRALRLVALFVAVETSSNAIGGFRRGAWSGLGHRTHGRLRALMRIIRQPEVQA